MNLAFLRRSFKKLRDIHGFSLIEITITLGISSFLVLIIQDVMNRTNTAERNANQNLSIQEVVSKALVTLNNMDGCTNTLTGTNPVGPTGTDIVFRDRRNALVFPVSNIYGTGSGRIQIREATISNYENSADPYYNGIAQATVTLRIRRGSAIGVDLTTLTPEQRGRLAKREGTSRLEEVHRIPVRVNADGGTISRCSYGLDTFQTNLERSCEMLGGTMGSANCLNMRIEAENAAVRSGTPAIPAYSGANPAVILDGNAELVSAGFRFYSTEFRFLDHFNDGRVGATYNRDISLGVMDFTSRVLAHGPSSSMPTTVGMVNSDGVILIGDNAHNFAPTSLGVAVGGNVNLGVGNRLTLTETVPKVVTLADENRIPTADWVAAALAETMTNNTTGGSATSIKNAILGGGTNAARNAILSFMCQNMSMTTYNRISATNPTSSSFNRNVPGVWDGTRCQFDVFVKSNCSVDGSCNIVNPNQLCIGGTGTANCKTRWPHLVKAPGACTWKNSCSVPSERTFGVRTSSNAGWTARRLCCPVMVDEENP